MVGVSVGGRVAVAVGSGVKVLVGSGVLLGSGVGLTAAAVSATTVAASASADGPRLAGGQRCQHKQDKQDAFHIPSGIVILDEQNIVQIPHHSTKQK
jgi:homoserine acetyltransferase